MVSRLLLPTYTALLRLAFASAPRLNRLTWLAKVTRRFIMQKARRHTHVGAPTACRRMVSGSFSLLCSRFFSPFLHSTGSLSVSREYLALRDGPRRFIQDFSCPALLRILLSLSLVSPTGLSPSLTGLSRPFGYLLLCLMQSFYPDSAETETVWAVPRSLATTDGIIHLFSFPVGNEMFQFPTFASRFPG